MTLRDLKHGDNAVLVLFQSKGAIVKQLSVGVRSVGRRWIHVGDAMGKVWTVEIESGQVLDEGSWKNHPRLFTDAEAANEYLTRREIEVEASNLLREGWRLQLSKLGRHELVQLRTLLRMMRV